MPVTAPLTDADLVEALWLAREHGSASKAAAAAGLQPSAMRDRVREAKRRGLTADTKVLSELDRERIGRKRAERDLNRLIKENDTAEKIRTEIYQLASRSPQPPAWVDPVTGVIGGRGIPVTIWSDWHYGEVVRPEEVGGCNTFNMDVARARTVTLVDATIDLCFNHMGKAKINYPGIIVMLGGDMLSGDIHEELLATNDRTTQQCINDLTDILAAGLERLADKFGRVFVPCVVGNHGRASKKPRMKGRVYTSHEWNIYCSLERHFRKDKRLSFLIPGESDAYFKVYGHRYLLTHGDSLGVKGGDGIIGSLGPIMRGALKVGKSEAQIGREFDTVVMGHWHQALWLPGIIVNGSLKGYDEYARLAIRAPYSRPSQQLWLTHPEFGITARWEIYLDKAHLTSDNSKWLEWQQPNT